MCMQIDPYFIRTFTWNLGILWQKPDEIALLILFQLGRILKRLDEAEEAGGEGRKMWLSYLAEVNEQFFQSSSCIKRQM